MTTTDRPRSGQTDLAKFVKDEVARHFGSTKSFLAETGIEKSNYYKVIADVPDIGPASFRRLEGALDLPRYLLDWIAEGKPKDMGTQYDRELWELHTLALNDSQRARMIARLEEKYAAGEYGEDEAIS